MEVLAQHAELYKIVYQEKLVILEQLVHVHVINVVLDFMDQVQEHAQHVQLWLVVQ